MRETLAELRERTRLLRVFGSYPAEVHDDRLDPNVQRLRDEISELDRSILDAVNRRLELVARPEASQAGGRAPFVDPDRESARCSTTSCSANRGPLSDEGLGELFHELLDLTKREVAGEGDAAASA